MLREGSLERADREVKEIFKGKNTGISSENDRVDKAPPGARSGVVETRIQREVVGFMGRTKVERGLDVRCARE